MRVLRAIAVVVAFAYFFGFSLALYGFDVRNLHVARYVALLQSPLPGWLPSPHVGLTQGTCYFDLLAVMVIAFLVDWLCSIGIFRPRKEDASATS